MWEIDFAKEDDRLFIRTLGDASINELAEYFLTVTTVFDQLNNSVLCTSVIYTVQTYKLTNQNLYIHYHIDNDEQKIRITSYELI